MDTTGKSQLKKLQTIRYVLPIVLFIIVASFETWEHILLEGQFSWEPILLEELSWDSHFTFEVFFFGIAGPTAVFIVLSYIIRLLEIQMNTSIDLEILNQDLEQKVAERTQLLEERNNELSVANEELQKVDQLKSDFVSLVSHELRGPLTTLNGGIEMALQEEHDISEETRRFLEIMSGESQRLTDFVQTILDVSRLDAGKLTLNPGPVAVNPLLRRVAEVVLAGKPREIIIKATKNLPLAWGDEIYLEKILCNLVSNADKFSPDDTPIEINSGQVNGKIKVTVIDHGPGIPPEMQEQVFKRFLRLETGNKISSKGWGLGLHLSQALAEAQGCSLRLVSPAHEDQQNPGTAFTLSIPMDTEELHDS